MVSTHLAVIGSPIEHSKSPAIHNAAYAAMGLDWDYGRYRIEANELSDFLKLRGSSWRGLSLTMPLKEVGFEISIPSCPVASATGVVNTLLHTDEGWEGYNTDSFGIQQAISKFGGVNTETVAILGSGATARSAVHAIQQLNPNSGIQVFARRESEVMGISTKPLASFYTSEIPELTISTLPGSVTHPRFETPASSHIFDVAYDPWPSAFSSNWSADHRISGLEMLLWQALIQVRIFHGGDGTKVLPFENEVFAAMNSAVKP